MTSIPSFYFTDCSACSQTTISGPSSCESENSAYSARHHDLLVSNHSIADVETTARQEIPLLESWYGAERQAQGNHCYYGSAHKILRECSHPLKFTFNVSDPKSLVFRNIAKLLCAQSDRWRDVELIVCIHESWWPVSVGTFQMHLALTGQAGCP
ncbi:hypothetical protein C8J56DRAFT_211232 [Mycena floridula]|nr:hypothetical protein C8J56DRAFT_211232 [Mycena floridula]